MKLRTIILTLTLSALTLLTSKSYGQERSEMTKENDRRDSIQTAAYKSEQVQIQKVQDEARMAEVKSERRHTKAIAKEAKRVEQEASDAARQSKNALRTEKKAQKARKQADRQAQKAARARNKSDKN